MPSGSTQLPLNMSTATEGLGWEEEEERSEAGMEGSAVEETAAAGEALWLWHARRKSSVQLGVFQACPQVAQGNGSAKEWRRK